MRDPGSYLRELDDELDRAAVPRMLRSRIVAEFTDHLACVADLDLAGDPSVRLGEPRGLARQFADELGTSFAKTAARRAFAALAVCGVLVVARFATLLPFRQVTGGEDTVALLVAGVAAQVAFVAGGLGLVRALRLRRATTIARDEAAILGRRAGVGLAAGAVAALAIPLHATSSGHAHTGSVAFSVAAMAAAMLALVPAVPAVVRATRLRPQAGGPAGDLLADFGPARPIAARLAGGSATRLALLIAFCLALVIALGGVAGDDPYDGILRAVFEGGAFLGCYAGLGRYLGLRR